MVGRQKSQTILKSSVFLFRVDASLEIGTGHMMRCLTLADALGAKGAKSTFVTRDYSGHVMPAIHERGHSVIRLSSTIGQSYGVHSAPPPHSAWLQADWREDAAITRATIQRIEADWLVVDHYALDVAWEEAALPKGVRLLVIDDLADRPHIADVLLDQNIGREASDYEGLLLARCDLRIGPSHALLRPEFARSRPAALARRAQFSRPEELLITLGGIDKDNVTEVVLDCLNEIPSASELRITAILGGNAPHINRVKARAETMMMPTKVVVGAHDMAGQMLRADICIGAAGSTAWERCALGLPTLQVVLADNQVAAASSMTRKGLSLELPAPDSPAFVAALTAGLDKLSEPEFYATMVRNIAVLTDGSGAARLSQTLFDWDCAHAN